MGLKITPTGWFKGKARSGVFKCEFFVALSLGIWYSNKCTDWVNSIF